MKYSRSGTDPTTLKLVPNKLSKFPGSAVDIYHKAVEK